uniref:Uncharacterized protein n=1 Tax=Rhizophora mucronata TaxID=61149 RepID=A0A2P2QZI8_RHIMU
MKRVMDASQICYRSQLMLILD